MAGQFENDPSTGPQRSTADSMADFGFSPEGWRDYLCAEIDAYDKETKKWRERAARVVKRYRDERGEGVGTYDRRYNILWSNVQTVLPAVYGQNPDPVVERRYLDPDNVARVASIILERCLEFQIEANGEFYDCMRQVLQDRLLPGMGTVWVRYQVNQSSPTGTVDSDYYDKLSGEQAAVDYVYWQDFGFVPARTWPEVPMVWRIVYMTRDQLVKRFGKQKGEACGLDYIPAQHSQSGGSPGQTDQPKIQVFKQARIYEVWDKRRAKVTWISKTMPAPLDMKDDPMKFPGFFPCPKPMFATNTTGNLEPVPDYVEYQDQANEIDDITKRLYHLTKALKVVGLYDGSELGVQRMLTEGVENQLIPVDTWAAFAEKGGIKGVVDFMPIDKIIEVVTQLTQIRGQLIQDVYQITGVSDIVRGSSDPGDTATAQRIKAQFASTRLNDMKMEMARFCSDTMCLMGHVILEFFKDDTIVAQSAIMQSPDGLKAIADAQAAMQARMQPPMAPPGSQPPGPPPPGGPPMGGPPSGAAPPMPGPPGPPPPGMMQ